MEQFFNSIWFDIIMDIITLVVGFVLLIKGADFFVEGSSSKMLLLPDIYQQWPPSIKPPDGAAGASLYQNVFHNTAGIMIIFPLVIIYLFCQRYLVQGIERSGLVG